MNLNPKTAIEFLVDARQEIGFNRCIVLIFHEFLTDKLHQNSTSVGRLRFIDVSIGESVNIPLVIPRHVEE